MKPIPTAKEFRENCMLNSSFIWTMDDVMIEFAKLHKNAAIKECIESAPSGSSTDTVSYEDVVECLKDCYPDKLIN